jgi:uncharacterized protein YfaS (alpha-2-macroglobulin family)
VLPNNVVLSALGSCTAFIPLPSGPRGAYLIHIKLAGSEQTHPITVAEYQPAAFEILAPSEPAHTPGRSQEAHFSAR